MTDDQKQQLLDQLASSIRVHCAALPTRMEVSDSWVMQLARNQVAAAAELLEAFEAQAYVEGYAQEPVFKDPDGCACSRVSCGRLECVEALRR